MRSIVSIAVCAAVSVAFSVYADAESYERYEPIVERMPFGVPPDGFDPTASAQSTAEAKASAEAEAKKAAEQAKLMSKVRICALNMTPAGVAYVGFVDSSDKTPNSYYLREGESSDGWTVTAIDSNALSVSLEKDGIEITLSLGEATGGKDAKDKNGKSAVPRASSSAGSSIGKLRQRHNARLAEEAEKAAKEKELAEERKRKAEEAEAARQEEARRAAEEKARQEAELQQQREDMAKMKADMAELRKHSAEKKETAEESASESAPDTTTETPAE